MFFIDVIDNTSELFGNDGPGNGFVGAASFSPVERPDFRVILDGMDSDVREGYLEVTIPVLVV